MAEKKYSWRVSERTLHKNELEQPLKVGNLGATKLKDMAEKVLPSNIMVKDEIRIE